jgi:PBP1b-binding outer membrane lipoprotein LpoB
MSQGAALGAAGFLLSSCASYDLSKSKPPTEEIDAATGQTVIPANDVTIAGQMVAHSIMDLPEVANASKPPLVRFLGVTNQTNGPVDTSLYTGLLRDRLLLLTREKLRFVERQLPPLTSYHVKHSKDVGGPIDVSTDADYRIMAQLRGNYDDDTYRLAIQFVDIHTGDNAFSGVYRIRREEQQPSTTVTTEPAAPGNPARVESTDPTPVDVDAPPPPPRGESNIQ